MIQWKCKRLPLVSYGQCSRWRRGCQCSGNDEDGKQQQVFSSRPFVHSQAEHTCLYWTGSYSCSKQWFTRRRADPGPALTLTKVLLKKGKVLLAGIPRLHVGDIMAFVICEVIKVASQLSDRSVCERSHRFLFLTEVQSYSCSFKILISTQHTWVCVCVRVHERARAPTAVSSVCSFFGYTFVHDHQTNLRINTKCSL